jgi:FHA domain
MSTQAQRPGLWSVEGPGVLAREEELVLLSGSTDTALLDRLLDLLTEIAGSGGDGRRFTQAVEEILDEEGTWLGHSGQPGPALLAFGPLGTGLAVTIAGAAWVEITTVHRTQRIVAGQPSMLLRCLVGSPVTAVYGGLGDDQADRGHTDRFSRLDAGIVRAGGLSYHLGPPGQPGAPEPAAADPEAVPVAAADEPPGALEHPAGAAAGPVAGAGPTSVEPETSSLAAAGAGILDAETVSPDVTGRPDVSGRPFDSVLLLDEGTRGGVEERSPLPLGDGQPHEAGGLSSPCEILGVYCKNGHFDDPEARFCAICGISMNQQTLVPQIGPRPPLGLLVLDGGAVFQLDADYVIGREPAVDAAVAAGEARPLRITDESGIVSRRHAKIELDGWRVLVADLGSANGTRIRLPDQTADQELTPRMPVRLAPGSHVDMGGAGLRYESYRGR